MLLLRKIPPTVEIFIFRTYWIKAFDIIHVPHGIKG